MLYDLRILARGGGADMRALSARFGDATVGGGTFRTEVGEAGQTVIIWPKPLEANAAPARRGDGADGEGGEERLARNPLGKHTMEVLRLAPFMEPPAPREIGRVWELRWYDFPAGTVHGALPAFRSITENAESGFPTIGCWTVETGPNLDRIYLLGGYRDWDHRDEVTAKLSSGEWLPASEPAAISGGSRLLLPTAFSPFR